jgi:hypothetical protein
MDMRRGHERAGKMLKTWQSGGSAPPQQAAAGGFSARRPAGGARSVGSFVPRLTRQAFEKFGFSAATLITDWAQIVGADLARSTEPERLRWPKPVAGRGEAGEDVDQGRPGATLHLRVDQGRALDIQYRSRQIIERINSYFGYRAVAELRIIQAPIGRRAPAPQPPPRLQPPARLPAAIAAIENAELREALARMAAGLAERKAARSDRR